MEKREIKFRAWDNLQGGKFEYWDFKTNAYDGIFWTMIKDPSFEPPQEYTGLKDKNGKESYESDSCKYHYWIQTSEDPDSLGKTFDGIGEIKFIEGCFMIDPIGGENPIPLHYSDLSFEIIGK